MTEDERKESMDILMESARIANTYGPQIINDADGYGAVAATTAAILLSSYTQAMGMTLHDAISLLMLVHKQTILMEREQ